jgi:endonuclease/exonuclease/phosphatase family metal-dependent hydrolase
MKRFLFLLVFAAFLGGALLRAQDENGQVTFCSYNLKNYLKMERVVGGKRTVGMGKSEKEIAAVVKFIVDIRPDVLGVCEIGAVDDLRDLQARLKAAGLDLPELETSHGGDPTRQLGLLSRFPIVARNSQTDLRYVIGDQIFPVQRGFLDATVHVRKGFELRCVGVHLKSKREVPEADQKLMRRNEAHLLRKHTESILKEKPDTKLLLHGDFNEDKAEASIVEIEGVSGMELSMHRINVKDSRGEAWTHYWEFQDMYSRFDYFFVSRPLEPYVDKRASHIYDVPSFSSGSDHRPIVLKIDLVKNAPKRTP